MAIVLSFLSRDAGRPNVGARNLINLNLVRESGNSENLPKRAQKKNPLTLVLRIT